MLYFKKAVVSGPENLDALSSVIFGNIALRIRGVTVRSLPQSPPRLSAQKIVHFRRVHRLALRPARIGRGGIPPCSGQTHPDAAKTWPDASRSRLSSCVSRTSSNRQRNGEGGPLSPAPRSSLPACTARLMQWFHACDFLRSGPCGFGLRAIWGARKLCAFMHNRALLCSLADARIFAPNYRAVDNPGDGSATMTAGQYNARRDP